MSDKPKCFIIMPISTPEDRWEMYGGDKDHFKHVLECLHAPAVEAAGYEVIPPMGDSSSIIMANIIQSLAKSDLVLCDVSCLNPNVFFEWGIRTALNKPVALVKDSFVKNLPFDTGQLHHETYDATLAGWGLDRDRKLIASHIAKTVGQNNLTNVMWRFYGIDNARLTHTEMTPSDEAELKKVKLERLIEDVLERVLDKRGVKSMASVAATIFPQPERDVSTFDALAKAYIDSLCPPHTSNSGWDMLREQTKLRAAALSAEKWAKAAMPAPPPESP